MEKTGSQRFADAHRYNVANMFAARRTFEISFPRFAALALAIGGSYWAITIMTLMDTPFKVFHPAVLPGFLLTAGYIIRTISIPPLALRRTFWVISILVQGAWLCMWTFDWSSYSRFINPASVWWAFATFASIAAALTEASDQED